MKKTFVLLAFAFCGLFAVDANAVPMKIVCPNGNTATKNVRSQLDNETLAHYKSYLQGIADAYCNCEGGGCSASWDVKYDLNSGGGLVVAP